MQSFVLQTSRSSQFLAPHITPRHNRALARCKAATMEVQKAPVKGTLTPEQVQQFREQGFLVLPGFSSKEEVDALKARVDQLLDEFDPSGLGVFSTRNVNKLPPEYFLNSAANISFFMEEDAFDEQGQLRQSKQLSVNKIGHALMDIDPVFRAFSRSAAVAGIARSLGFQRPLPVQSQYIFKQPKIGGEVLPHQDSSFLLTEPLSCLGLWWAVEDATKENGCLWAQPGIHKQGLLRKFIRTADGGVTFDKPSPQYDLSQFVPLECPAGSLVLLHGENVHYSCANTSDVSRHAYSLHIVESTPGYTWLPENWAHRPADQPWEPLYDNTTQ